MSEQAKRPILLLLTSHWMSMLGVALVTTAGFSWLFVLPTQLRGHTNNPYIGIVVFIFIPVIFILGLVLIGLGILLARRRLGRVEQGLAAVQFCGQSCHVMNPEFTAHQNSPHASLECVECHVAPGAAGWVESKKAG